MRLALAISLVLVLAGCASSSIRDFPSSGVHVVQRGETLYSIATSHGLDWKVVARVNRLSPPYTLHVGQRLRLAGTASRDRGASSARDTRDDAPPDQPPTAIDWSWPTEGRVVTSFKPGHATRKGIDIAGRLGQPVHAAASGEVAYSGSGLPGYGKLIILKHDARYLSAYAYNHELLVSEGQRVQSGQMIARMGQAEVGKPLLHFEIRLDGDPIDPLRHLPRR
ncbi:MAG: peptidoglycan DD-metalloendopeptidase family protein [Pseudomonadota bacterium]